MRTPRQRSNEKRRAHAAYEQLAKAEHASIVRAAYTVTRDIEVAREVTQDAFADLFVHWHKVRHYDKPGAWLRRIAIRKAIKVTERNARQQDLRADAASTTGEPDTDSSLLALLGELSPKQRAAIYLRYYEELPVTEVATALGCEPSTASVHLSRGRHRLAELLGNSSDDTVNRSAAHGLNHSSSHCPDNAKNATSPRHNAQEAKASSHVR